jgi:hypothetical protein
VHLDWFDHCFHDAPDNGARASVCHGS